MSDTAGTREALSAEERIRRRDALHPDDPMFRHNRASPGDDYHAAISDRHELLATLERDRAAFLDVEELAEKVQPIIRQMRVLSRGTPYASERDNYRRYADALAALIEGSDPASPLCDFDGCGLPADHPGDHGGWWADPASPEPHVPTEPELRAMFEATDSARLARER